MKKLLAILLCVAMLATLAACGNDVAPEDVRGEQNAVNEGKEFGMGQTNGLNYENKFIGIGCNLDSAWTFYTDDQIRELNQQSASLAGEEFEELMKDAAVVYDMYASNDNASDTININLEKSTEAAVLAADLNQTYQSIQPTIKQGYENMGFSDITFNITTATLDGKSIPVMKTTASISGVSFYLMSVMLKCDAGYMATITIGTLQTDNTTALLSKFYWTE